MKLKETIMIAIAGLIFMLVTGIAKANPVLNWFEAEKNKTINKFITNVESRIYANLSKQLVDNMFGTTCDSSTTTCPTSGTATVEGAQIYWVKDTSTEIITLTITDVDGTTTTMTVPLGDFKF